MIKKTVLVLLVVILVAAGYVIYQIGPSNLIGILLYDQRREGDYMVGQQAPDVALVALDGVTRHSLTEFIGPKPLVIVFGSFT